MERKWFLWTISLVVGLLFWLYFDTQQEIDSKKPSKIIDPNTGVESRPLLDLAKVIKHTTEYIESTTATERLYNLEYQLYLGNIYILDQQYSSGEDLRLSGWPVANQTECGRQVKWILRELEEHSVYSSLKGQLGHELTSLMDTFGRPEPGLHSGAVNWMGSSMACDKVSLDAGRIKTRYCIARMRPTWWPRDITPFKNTSIRVGICVPETCDSSSFDDHGDAIARLAKWELPDLYKSGFSLESLFCLPDERSPIRQLPLGGKIYLSLVGCWIALVLGASIVYEVSSKPKKHQSDETHPPAVTQLVVHTEAGTVRQQNHDNHRQSPEDAGIDLLREISRALSIVEAFKSLEKHRSRAKCVRAKKVNLDSLNLVKSFMTILVIHFHTGLVMSWYSRSLGIRIDISTGLASKFSLSATHSVSSFFVIFGLLTTYSLMKKFSTKRLGNPLVWLGINIDIMTKIGPVFMLVYSYMRLISPYTGSGPWWDYGVDEYSLKGLCLRESWWKIIPYFGNFDWPPLSICIPPGWFIVSYSQIALLLPLVVYLICKSPNNLIRITLTGYILLVGAILEAVQWCKQTLLTSINIGLYGGLIVDLLGNFEMSGYFTGLRHVGGVCVGCLAGYLLRQYEVGSIKRLPKWLTNPTTIVVAIFLLLLILSGPILSKDEDISMPTFALMDALTIFLWPILNAIIFINLATTASHKLLPRLFSHPLWDSFNKLGLAILLIHFEIIMVINTNSEHAPSILTSTNWFRTLSLTLIISTVLSILIYVFVQAPMAQIMALRRKVYQSINKDELPKEVTYRGIPPTCGMEF